jgi:hypothetical protein
MQPFLAPPPIVPTNLGYGLFISHAWDYAYDYEAVVRLLKSDLRFKWEDLSVPIEKSIATSLILPKSNRRILKELEERIKQADALLVLAGMYVTHSGWIQSEIEVAQDFGKPIIGIKPRGQERIPLALQFLARDLVGWTTDSIVGAIRTYAKPTRKPTRKVSVPIPAPIPPVTPTGPHTSALNTLAKLVRPFPPFPTTGGNTVPSSPGPPVNHNIAAILRLLDEKQ